MRVQIHFYSYFKDLTGCEATTEDLPAGSTLGDLRMRMFARFPRLQTMKNSILTAVDVEYQDRNYVLQPDDEVSFFPPVQGG